MAGRRVFNKYELIRRIAQGGMGDVYLARQITGIDRLVILKSLRHESSDDKDFVEQFLDEARVAALLNHPNVVSVYDVGEWDGTFWIVMEYIKGEDLSRLWYAAAKAGIGLPFQVTVRIVHDASLGLDHAHRACDVEGHHLQIVHRDVSPQNIMVRADGVTKVVDFGIAKAKNRVTSTQAGLVKGKLQYMSPEQVRGEPLDGKSDQFSLGIVLWEMCTGKRLFKAESEIATLNKILTHPVPHPSTIVKAFPQVLEDIILKMLEREPRRRFASCAEVSAALLRFLEKTPRDKRVSVADFVQRVLGDELEQRTADLTPETMPLREPPPSTVRTPPPRFSTEADQSPLGGDSAVPTDEDHKKPIRIRRADGTVLAFQDFDEVRKEVFFGNLTGQDRIAVAGNPDVALEEHHALGHLFDDGPAPAPFDPDDETGLWVPEKPARPAAPAAGAPSEDDRALGALFDRAAHDAAEPAFTLGAGASLPLEPSGPVDGFSRTPATDGGEHAPPTFPPEEVLVDEDLRRALGKGRGSWGWLFAGLFFLVVSFPVVLYFAFPDVFDRVVVSLVRSTPQKGPTAPAALLGVLRKDDPATLEALLSTMPAPTDPYDQAAASLLQSGIARALSERAALAPADKRPALAKQAEAAAAAAYAAASSSRVGAGDSPWPHLAMAHHHKKTGAALELGEDLRVAAARAGDDAALVAREQRYLEATWALHTAAPASPAADSARQTLRDLARQGDRRAAFALAQSLAAAGQLGPAKAELDALLTEAEGHRRAGMLLQQLETGTGAGAPAEEGDTKKDAKTDTKKDTKKPPPDDDDDDDDETVTKTRSAADLLAAAERVRRRGRSKPAVRLYEKALAKDPDLAKAHRGLGWAQLDLGQTAASIRSFRAAVRLAPRDPEAHLGLAEALRFAGRPDEAIPSYERVLELAPRPEDKTNAENALRLLRR